MTDFKRLEKRRRILSAARSLFGRTHDFRRVSLEAIAREARVSPTTIYNSFGNRETLVYEVIKELVSATLERNRTLIRSELPFPQKLIGVISNKLDVVEKMNGEILTRLIGQDEKITPFIDEICQREIKPLWQELLADGKKQGYIDLVLDDAALLVYLDVLRAGFQARPDVLQGFKESMGLFKQLTHLMFYGFLIKDIDLFLKEELHDRKIHHRGEPDLPIRGATGGRPYQL
ncbi:TetR/AcrR family transcriptional regulator [Chloroflexota bacterium]